MRLRKRLEKGGRQWQNDESAFKYLSWFKCMTSRDNCTTQTGSSVHEVRKVTPAERNAQLDL